MNKTAIKNFAIWARNKLIADVQYRAGLMGITEKDIQNPLPQSTSNVEFYDIGTAEPYSIAGHAIQQRKRLVHIIRQKEKDSDYPTAYKYILEEVAYTWFNRLIAIRFMEVNDYLPSHIRVLSSESGKVEPDLVTTPFDAGLDFTPDEEQALLRLKNDNKLDEAFRLLFIKQCNALNAVLPALFEQTSDYTELLLSLSVVDQEGDVYRLVHDIAEEDFNVEKGGQVEIIGWLYQYYNTEPKNAAFAKKSKITQDEIPAVTQLFTPDWIVRYMVENSLGRLWVEGHPDGGLKAAWKYYLEEAPQEPEVEAQLAGIRKEYAGLRPEDIRIIDPCMGSGHILVYAFDVLMQIYESAGYSQRDAAQSILEHNLYGLDIDDRAAQLAYFAVMMKARQYDRRILTRGIQPHVYAIQSSKPMPAESWGYLGEEEPIARRLWNAFVDAKEYGSLINPGVTPEELDRLKARLADADEAASYGSLVTVSLVSTALEVLWPLIHTAEILARKYDAVITNPPYMGSANMDPKLSDFVKKHYPDTKSDMSTVMMERSLTLCKTTGFMAMINIPVWMFLSSYEKLREHLITENTIINMVHPGRGIFGSDFGTTTFVIGKTHIQGYSGMYCRLFDKQGEVQGIEEREQAFLSGKGRYTAQQSNFSKIPGSPVAYWVSKQFIDCFQNQVISDIAQARLGMATANNDRFLRLWHEIALIKIGFNVKSRDEAQISKKKFFPYNKGGEFRKWYGNRDYVVNWENDGHEIRNFKDEKTGRIRSHNYNLDFIFKKGITWTFLSASKFSARCFETGFLCDAVGCGLYANNTKDILYIEALLCSSVTDYILNVLNPSISYQPGNIGSIPLCISERERFKIECMTEKCISDSKQDWDSYETSWDFKRHPMV